VARTQKQLANKVKKYFEKFMKNKIFVITGCSGVGKTTVGYAILKKMSKLEKVITITTREKRPKEKNGKDYYFIRERKFKSMLKNRELFEWDEHYENYYGNSKKELKRIWKKDKAALMIIDINGAMTIKKKVPESVIIFIKPGKISNLKKRILARGEVDPELLKSRLQRIRKEISQAKRCDYRVVNRQGELQKCIDRVERIIKRHMRG